MAKFLERIQIRIIVLSESTFANIFGLEQAPLHSSSRNVMVPRVMQYIAMKRVDPLLPGKYGRKVSEQSRLQKLLLHAQQKGVWHLSGSRHLGWIEFRMCIGDAYLDIPQDTVQKWDLVKGPWLTVKFEVVDGVHPENGLVKRGIAAKL